MQQKDKTYTNKHLYQMTMHKNLALQMVERLARFYVKKHNMANLDAFIPSYFGILRDQNIPWLDIPFFINSMEMNNFPNLLRKNWLKHSLVGSIKLTDTERANMSVNYFIENKQEIIQLYMNLLSIYFNQHEANIKMRTLDDIINRIHLDATKEQLKKLLETKITLYDIFGDIRIMETDFVKFLAKQRIQKPIGLVSDVTFAENQNQPKNTEDNEPEDIKKDEPDQKTSENNHSLPVSIIKDSENLAGDNSDVNAGLVDKTKAPEMQAEKVVSTKPSMLSQDESADSSVIPKDARKESPVEKDSNDPKNIPDSNLLDMNPKDDSSSNKTVEDDISFFNQPITDTSSEEKSESALDNNKFNDEVNATTGVNSQGNEQDDNL